MDAGAINALQASKGSSLNALINVDVQIEFQVQFDSPQFIGFA